MFILNKSNEAGDKDKFSIKLTAKTDGLRVNVESQSIDKDEASKEKIKFTLAFDRLVQYTTGSSYNGGATVGSAYVLGDKNWNDFACNQADGKYTCSASTSDGVFTATFEFSGTAFNSGGQSLSPEDLKISVLINNFPYSDANARLALLVNGWAKTEYKDRDDSAAEKKVTNGGSAFTWVTSVSLDGTIKDDGVAVSPVTFADDGSDKKFSIWFSFLENSPDVIDWDPTVSVNGASWLAPASLLLVSLVALLFA